MFKNSTVCRTLEALSLVKPSKPKQALGSESTVAPSRMSAIEGFKHISFQYELCEHLEPVLARVKAR